MKNYQENIEVAQTLKSGINFSNLNYFAVIDNKLFSAAENNTILFETIF